MARALGDLINGEDKLFYSKEIIEHFGPLPIAGPSDWLTSHPETGQTYEEYTQGRNNEITPSKNVIYLLPLYINNEKKQNGEENELISKLSIVMKIFYQLDVKILPKFQITENVQTRIHFNALQLNTKDILNEMEKLLPKDAYCMLSFTNIDLYPSESWNYVFGQARLRHRVGVFSFARYDPIFFDGVDENEADEEYNATRKILIRERSMKVMLHETGHMFGIKHCIHFSCLMNGSNHMEETDRRYPFLCPVCLRKIQFRLNLTPAKLLARYNDLLDFLIDFLGEDHKFAKWLSDHISIIQNNVNEI